MERNGVYTCMNGQDPRGIAKKVKNEEVLLIKLSLSSIKKTLKGA